MKNKIKCFLFPFIFLFISTSCANNEISKDNFTLLGNQNQLEIKFGSNVNPEIGNQIYQLTKEKFSKVKVNNNKIEIRACHEMENCDYVLTYDCEYSCWGNTEMRLCGIKAFVSENKDIEIEHVGLLGTQIEC